MTRSFKKYRGFTAYERTASQDLDYAQFRYYSSGFWTVHVGELAGRQRKWNGSGKQRSRCLPAHSLPLFPLMSDLFPVFVLVFILVLAHRRRINNDDAISAAITCDLGHRGCTA